MTASLVGAALVLTANGGLFGLLLGRNPRTAQLLSAFSLLAGSALGIAAAASVLAGGAPWTAALPWSAVVGRVAVRLDALSAWFLVPVLAVPALGAVYGLRYHPQEEHGPRAARLQVLYGLVTAAMALVVLADDGVLFLVAWEVMALSGFFLVLTDADQPEVRPAAYLFLAAAHASGFALAMAFSVVASERGTFAFAAWRGLDPHGARAALVFVLLLVGFGLKAGLVPLHFWLPPAHAAAPSHVSALLSGVLIKTGLYGLLRVTGFFEAPPPAWGGAVLAVGAASAVLGVAYALAQHDLKRLLAFHSVENVGIIAMGAGLALLAGQVGQRLEGTDNPLAGHPGETNPTAEDEGRQGPA